MLWRPLDCRLSRVINAMKLIVQDGNLVDKEDLGILDRMAQFASGNDVFKIAAAKQLLVAIKRVVRFFFPYLRPRFLNFWY